MIPVTRYAYIVDGTSTSPSQAAIHNNPAESGFHSSRYESIYSDVGTRGWAFDMSRNRGVSRGSSGTF